MTLNIPDEYVPLVINALEHYHAYTRAAQREDARYQQAADWFKRKGPRGEDLDQPIQALRRPRRK